MDRERAQRLTSSDSFPQHPGWSPDGAELVVNSYDLGNIQSTPNPSNLYAIKPDGTGLRQLRLHPRAARPEGAAVRPEPGLSSEIGELEAELQTVESRVAPVEALRRDVGLEVFTTGRTSSRRRRAVAESLLG